MCHSNGRRSSFLCPAGTAFDQRFMVCNWNKRVDCPASSGLFHLNSQLYNWHARHWVPQQYPNLCKLFIQNRCFKKEIGDECSKPYYLRDIVHVEIWKYTTTFKVQLIQFLTFITKMSLQFRKFLLGGRSHPYISFACVDLTFGLANTHIAGLVRSGV